MTTKLVSANMGIVLVVERDGKQERLEFSATTHEGILGQPLDIMREIAGFLDEHLGTDMDVVYEEKGYVEFAKPKRIKAPRAVSQKEFNRKIKGLGY